jgi:putative transposase
MHLTLKLETTKPAGANFLQQQARFDDFVEEFNTERPHQALDMACPAERYRIWLASFMDYDLGYFDDETRRLEPPQNPFGSKVLPMSQE